MRISILLFLSALVWADNTPPPPVVRDAYEMMDGKPVRSARLRSHIQIVVCQSEYEAWRNAQSTRPDVLLYLNGKLMKKAIAASPDLIKDDLKDDALDKERESCDGAAKDAGKAAADAEAAAKSAADALANEKDAAKLKDAKTNADAKDAAAKAAREKAASAAKQAHLLALPFFLDPALVADPSTKDAWLEVLAEPWKQAPVKISAGTDKDPWPSKVEIGFERLHLGWLAGWAVLFAVAVYKFVQYARTSEIIRDSGTLPAGTPANAKKAYSLGRTQMALWTFVIAPALAFIFMVTWNASAISNGVLVLMGISFGTTLLAAVSDATAPPKVSVDFLTDLVTDDTGPSMHRYQMVLFTLILVVIFIAKTAAGLVMPEFDNSLLALMGISNGTYLGFKMQGK